MDGLLTVGWVASLAARWRVFLGLAPVYVAVAVLPDVVAYVAIHIRDDTTWYLLSDRSLRIRRGIWIIRETTTTCEIVQKVELRQGPVQRLYGIASLVVETAEGGGGEPHGTRGPETLGAHAALLEAVSDATRLRDLILARVRRSRSAGLGDELSGRPALTGGGMWTEAHVAMLREIRDAVAALS